MLIGRTATRSSRATTVFLAILMVSVFPTMEFAVNALKSILPFSGPKRIFHNHSLSSSTEKNNNETSRSSKNQTTKRLPLYSFVEARKIARGHGFNSRQEFLEYDCPGAYQLPKNADEVWSQEWTSWEDFLGIPIQNYNEAREIAQTHVGRNSEYGATNEAEYQSSLQRIQDNDISNIASRLPYRPNLKYKNKGWVSWKDFLG